MNNPKISVIIPVYNVEKYLAQCLDSVVNQTFKDIEIICINDGSTDGSLNILQKYASNDDRIIIINKENRGVSAARNDGLERVAGDYIMFFDSDDYYCDGSAFEIAYNSILETHSDIGIFGYYNLSDSGLYIDCFYSKFKEAYPKVGANNYFDYPIFVHDKIFKTSFLREHNIKFDTDIKNAEDFLFSLMCYFNSPKYTIINKCLYVYRENRPNSATNNYINCINNDAQAFIALYELPEFKKQSLDFQLKIANRFMNAALWYIGKFDNSLKLIQDSKILLNFMEAHYPIKQLQCLYSYKKLKNYKLKFLLHNIFSIRNSFNKTDKTCTVLGVQFKFKKSVKKIPRNITEGQQFIKNVFSTLYNSNCDVKIEPLFKNAESRALVFCFDNNYAKYFGVALKSLIEHSCPTTFYDIVIFSDDLSERNEVLLKNMLPQNFSIRIFNITSIFNIDNSKELKMGRYWSISAYYRLFIPLLMKTYRRVLYCDSDIVFNNSIDELFDIPFDNKLMMAITDSVTPMIAISDTERQRYAHMKNILGLKNPECYVNSGVFVINNEDINIQNYLDRVLAALDITGLMYPDQDILNVVFEDNIKYLPWKYNFEWHIPIFCKNDTRLFFGKFRQEYVEGYNNPSILHFTSYLKPWSAPNELFADIFWKYARQTPFYEEIIYENTIGNNFIKETKYTLTNLNMKRRIYFNYYRSKILSYLTFGKIREHYKSKRLKLKNRIRNIRHYSKL